MLHQPLTPEQQEKYDHRFDAPGTQQYSQNYAQDPGYGQNETYDPNQGYVQDGSYDPNQAMHRAEVMTRTRLCTGWKL